MSRCRITKAIISNSVIFFFFEIALSILLYIVFSKMFNSFNIAWGDPFLGCEARLFELNNALAIALVLSLVISKGYTVKGRNLKRIAKSCCYFIIANSIVLAIAPLLNMAGLGVAISAFGANLIKLNYILHDILEVY